MSKKSSVSSNKSDGNGLGDGVAVGEDEVHSQADQIEHHVLSCILI